MAEETIRVIVDDAQLNDVIARIDEASVKAARLGAQAPIIPSAPFQVTPTTTPTTPITTASRNTATLNSMILTARKNAVDAGINLDDLPTLNRDMRLLGGTLNLPIFRQASAVLFQARRGVRAAEARRVAKALETLDPTEASRLSVQALIGQAAMVAFVTKIVVTTINKFIEDERQANIDLENMFQEGLDISFNETKLLLKVQTGFATRWSQLQEMIKTEGFISAIKQMVIGSLPAIVQGEYRGAASYRGEPRDRWQLFEDIQNWVERIREENSSGNIIQGESIIHK